jgi:long-chain acyl-CoA synthetase
VTVRYRFLAGEIPSRVSLIEGPTPLRFGELAERVGRTRSMLSEWPSGTRIACALADDDALTVLFAACLAQKLSLLVLDPGAGAAQVHHALGACEARVAFVDRNCMALWALESRKGLVVWPHEPPVRKTLFTRLLGKHSERVGSTWPACAADLPPLSQDPGPIPAETEAVVLRTSGTSGVPKLAIITHGNLAAQAITMPRQLGLGPDARVLNLSPASHVDGITGIYIALFTGTTLVRFGEFNIPRIPELLDAFYRHRVNAAVVTPTLLRLLLKFAEGLGEAMSTGDLRLLVSTAEPLAPELWQAFEAETGVEICDMFGMTEVGNVLFSGPDAASRQPGSVGLPVDAQVRVVDDSGAPLPFDSVGELQVAGPSVFPGYVGEPPTGPWFATGDWVRQSSSGHVTVVGRKKSVVIVGGRNVHPEEVERALATHPAVAGAAVLGIRDPLWGERVVAAVEADGNAVTPAELTAHVASRVADDAVPRLLLVLDALPRAPSGKVDRSAVLALLQGGRDQQTWTAEDLERQVLALAAAAFRVPFEGLSPLSTARGTPGWDSMAHLDLVIRLEQQFQIALLPREIMGLDSLGTAIRLVAEKRGG